MIALNHQIRVTPRELSELSAIMRAIAHERKGAAPALRSMAEDYEIAAAGGALAENWGRILRG